MNDELKMAEVRKYQSDLFKNYQSDLDLPRPYTYFFGNPIETIVPLDTKCDSIFILGAYPSARFATIQGLRDVPIGDNCGPFSSERYYDGSSVRSVKSGEELEEHYLKPLGIQRSECWITDLVRVFLFKEGHVKKYKQLKPTLTVDENRSRFEYYANAGMEWLYKELTIARPKVIITLGAEVAGVIRRVEGNRERTMLLSGKANKVSLNEIEYNVIHLVHPGIVMRPESKKNPWPSRHKLEHIPDCKRELDMLGCLISEA